MKIPVKVYTDVTGLTLGQIAKLKGELVRIGNKQYIMEVV